MARNLRVEIDGDSSSGRKAIDSLAAEADKAAKQLKNMEAKADGAAIKARKLAEAEERAAEKTRQLMERMRALQKEIADNGDETGDLTRKMERLQIAVKASAHATDDYRRSASRAAAAAREQARAYDQVGDNARQAARAVALARAAAALPSGGGRGGKKNSLIGRLLGFGADGTTTGAGALASIGSGLAGTPVVGPLAIGAGAAAAIPAASFIGGAAGGGILAGLGGAAAAGGLAGAWMGDPAKFSAQWNTALDSLERRFSSSSTAAFGDKLTSGLKEADRVMRDLPVERFLALSQSFVEPLAQGAGGGITNLANGITDALEKAQPVIDKLGPELANLGNDFGDMFRIISHGSDGGALALGDLVAAIGWVAKATGVMILGFEKAYESIHNFESANFDFIASVPVAGGVADGLKEKLFGIHSSAIVAGRSLEETGGVAGGMAERWGEMATEAARAALETLGLNDALSQTRETMFAMADADMAVAQGWLDLNEELKDGKKTLDGATQAGLDNQKAILSQAEALERQRQQAIETGGGTADAVAQANAAYDAAIQKLKDAARAAHFTDAEVDALLTSYGALPAQKTTEIKTPGLPQALDQGISLGNALNRIDGNFTAHVDLTYTNHLPQGISLGNLLHRARGGTASESGPTVMGEHGAEIAWLNRDQYVSTAEQTKQLVSQMATGGQATSFRFDFSGVSNSWLGQAVQAEVLRGGIQVYAGGDLVTIRP